MEFPIARLYADARETCIYGGTSEVMKSIISKSLGLLPRKDRKGLRVRIEGLSALVTGGASGLGFATARLLTERGASVVLMDLPSSAGQDAAERLGPSASFAAADVTDTDSVQAALDTAEENGPLRAVVHCAGQLTRSASSTSSAPPATWMPSPKSSGST